jgi:hypothetical protein
MIPERVPGQLGEEAMVLVAIREEVREHEVGLEGLFDLLEDLFDTLALIRKEAGLKSLYDNLLAAHALEKPARTALGFCGPPATRAEHNPAHFQVRPFTHELQQRAATTNFNVIGVRPEAKHSL